MTDKPHKIPFDWQRAIVSYLFAAGISVYTNALLWGHLDSIQHPNAFWLKLGLLFVVDLVAFVLVTWHLFARAGFTRGYCFIAAAVQLVLMLVHAGAVAKLDASVTENRATIAAIAEGQAKIAGAEAEGKMRAATQGAMQANARGQRGLASQITREGGRQASSVETQQAFLEATKDKQKGETFLPQAYLDGAMYYALMVISGLLLFGALAASEWHKRAEDVDGNGIPDWVDRANGRDPQPKRVDPLPKTAGATAQADNHPKG